ncbi:OLC1v1023051C1 [Oldenlandia corymbosa var. corymbosa]|uniref:RING-type E3 ubiquitin transferase n=1 Tax=Oldenlandia corymbosa var. corymbosa TaxID=529605 RepID=A0AAV1BZK4_OLDCO|nr:OLC1v1023051C1 [Oldenlandia corymbosa var. corymbosa]
MRIPQLSCSKNLSQLPWLYALLFCFLVLFSFFSCSAAKLSYADHCADVVPESNPTVGVVPIGSFPVFDLSRSYIRVGDKIDKVKTLGNQSWIDYQTFVAFRTRNVLTTSTRGIYKVEGFLVFRFPGYGNYSGRITPSFYRRRRGLSRIFLSGFWSEDSRKLCMVTAVSGRTQRSKSLDYEGVFELNCAEKNATVFTSLAKGSFVSVSPSNSNNYFEPIKIVSFPSLNDYNYTLSSRGCLGGNDIPPKQSLSLQQNSICSMLQWKSYDLELKYAAGCKSSQDCSPIDEDLPYLSLSGFQCSEDEGKLRYIASFRGRGYGWHGATFDPNRTLIGEGSWDNDRNQLCIAACRVLNPSNSLEDVSVGECSIRLSLRFPLVWTIRDTSSINGLIWSNKTATDAGYFRNISISSPNFVNNGVELPGLKYEFTEMQKVRELCPANLKAVNNSGNSYPKGNSGDMRFDMYVEHSKERIAWGYADPLFVGDKLFGQNSELIMDSSGQVESISYSDPMDASQMNVSYRLSFSAIKSHYQNQLFPIPSSSNFSSFIEISAEGVYDAETGHLCMVGCRDIYLMSESGKSQDCEMFIEFQFSPLNSKVGRSIQGTIKSNRAKADSLYFEPLKISSRSYYGVQVKKSLWRMDLEIVMVLISNTLLCVFVALQIFYVRKHPEVLPFISLVMLAILTLGRMIPLGLNLEALLLKHTNRQHMVLEGEGWLELNEVSVRVANLVVFLLLLLLLQMAWTSRKANGDGKQYWAAEKRTLYVTLVLSVFGGIITLLVEWMKSSAWNGGYSHQVFPLTYLKSYSGLVLDGFLLPQILFNIFQSSAEKSLSCSFYIGTTFVRLLPHAYDLYRVHSFRQQDYYGSYIYANPKADFYSIAWDVIIVCGCVVLAVIIWFQQRFGGRGILPRRFLELASYEKVPAVSSE